AFIAIGGVGGDGGAASSGIGGVGGAGGNADGLIVSLGGVGGHGGDATTGIGGAGGAGGMATARIPRGSISTSAVLAGTGAPALRAVPEVAVVPLIRAMSESPSAKAALEASAVRRARGWPGGR
ncbi:hypothetical protein I551_1885, partial [Mycobacterium ulcerans str. Harvey]